MASRGYGVENVKEALANAGSIRPSADVNATDDGAQDRESLNQCRNPFCQRVLHNSYASYCEDQAICQRYRALRLQCLANAENTAIQGIEALGRTDSFLVVETRRSADVEREEKREAESSAPYVIPRRKCPTSVPTAAAAPSVSSENRPAGSAFRRGKIIRGGDTTRRNVPSVGAGGTKKRKRPQLGPRAHFNDVLALFDRTMPVPTATAASQTPVRKSQKTRFREAACKPSIEPRSTEVTRRWGDQGERYGQLVARPCTDSSSGALRLPSNPSTSSVSPPLPSIARDNHRDPVFVTPPSLPVPSQNRGISFTENRLTGVSERHGSDSRPPCEYEPQRTFNHQRWLEATSSQTSHCTESECTSPVVNVPHSQFVQTPPLSDEYPNGNVAHRDFYERGGCGAWFAGNFEREDIGRLYQYSYRDSQRLAVRVSRFNGEGNVDCAVGRSWDLYPRDHREERRDVAAGVSSLSFRERFQPSDGGHNDGVGEASTRQSVPTVEHPLDRRQHSSSQVSAPFLPHPTVAQARNLQRRDEGAPRDFKPDSEPTFSCHESFMQSLLSLFIQTLPDQLQPVMNETKKPRKLRWYVEYAKKIERSCNPYVKIDIQSMRVVVKVQHRVWLKLKGPSTAKLLQTAIRAMRDEALSWRALKSEAEQCLQLHRTRVGDEVDLSNVFLRAWDSLKSRGGAVTLPRQADYFYGTRLHHWKFVVGNVEIGGGSHEEKREAFRLAARSAASFLLGLDDGQNGNRWRPPRVEQLPESDECEFLFERSVGDEPLIVGPTQVPATSVSSSNQDPPATVQLGQNENDAIEVFSPSPVHESSQAMLPIEDSEFSQLDLDMPDISSLVLEDLGATDTGASVNATTPNTDELRIRYCSMCEMIRIRNPSSAGCRRCQLDVANTLSGSNPSVTATGSSSEQPAMVSTAPADDVVEPPASRTHAQEQTTDAPSSVAPAPAEAATASASQPAAERLRRFFELFRLSSQ